MVFLHKKMRFLSPSPLVLASVILCVVSASISEAAGIPLGSTLSPSNASSWSSPDGSFNLGFVSDPRNSSLYLAAITYSDSIPVWSAGGDNTSVDSGGSLELRSDGNLRLVGGSGAVVWESGTGGRGVASAELLDTGDFVLKNSSSVVVWNTFGNPTDTILVSQNFTLSQTLRSGNYSFKLLPSGNLSLLWNDSTTYFNEGFNSSFTANLSSPVLSLLLNGIVTISDSSNSSSVNIAYSSDFDAQDNFRFLRLDSDGNLRTYSASAGNATVRWSAIADQCEVFGYCGNMGICSYNDSSLPVCRCPSENFEFVNPSDRRQGCKRKTELKDCPGNSTMLESPHTQFFTYASDPDITTEQFYIGINSCKTNCLNGEACVASTSLADGSGLCYIKTSSFVSGYESAAIPSTSFIKVCSPAIANEPPSAIGQSSSTSKLKGWVVAVAVLGTLLTLACLELGLWWCFCQRSLKYGPLSAQYALLEYASGAPMQFSYRELQRSTKGFKEKLGEGGFGVVYKGEIANRTVVAVKQLEGIEQGEKQFRMEVATISCTHHLNLVRLVGFCSEGRHRLLVYEFMKNSSLDSFLFSKESSRNLSWIMRFNIAVGTARGLAYLHEECRDCIIHCDVKPENILLDDNYIAKVSDFGLAKLINQRDHRRTLTSVRGTRGYLAPEWLANLPATSKSDVYSYGMVLLEIVSGRRNFDMAEDTSKKKFSTWAYEEFERGNLSSIMDKRLEEKDVDMGQLKRALQVSFWCIQEQPSIRPSMGKVVQMLDGIMEIDRPPAPKNVDSGSFVGSMSTSAISTFTTPVRNSSGSMQADERSSSDRKSRVEKASSSLLSSEQFSL